MKKSKEKQQQPNKANKLIKLSSLAKATGLSKQTIQYYLMLGLMKEAERTPGGHRLFDETSIERAKLINKLNKTGYSLRDIRELFLKNK